MALLLGGVLSAAAPGRADETPDRRVDAPVTLSARDAVLDGDGATYHVWIHGRCIGDWRDVNTRARWTVDFLDDGPIAIEIEAAAGVEAAGSEFVVSIGDQEVLAQVTPTKGWEDFKTTLVGEIKLASAGRSDVAIRPVKISAERGLMNLRRVVLRGHAAQLARQHKWHKHEPPARSEVIADGITRFVPASFDAKALGPSFAVLPQPGARADGGSRREPRFVSSLRRAPDRRQAAVQPAFGRSEELSAYWRGSPAYLGAKDLFTAHVASQPFDSLYGTGEIAGGLLRNGHVSYCWNTDAFGYHDGSLSLYQSHPWVLAVRADGTAYGVLADTTWQCEIDVTDGIRFSSDGPPFTVIVIEGDSPQQVVMRLAELTGKIEMPPRWALGYQQCRFSYYPDSRVREIAEGFRRRKIPCDVIWMDIDYMDAFRIFTFDKKHFPDPRRLNEDLHTLNFKTVWMIDPGVMVDKGYAVYDEGTAGDHWVKTADGKEYHGRVWPGPCAFPDYTRPETRAWWAGLYKPFMAQGVDGVWNDMNEPAVFYDHRPTGTMPGDNVHRGGGDLPAGPHAQYHNVYGLLMSKATREGVLAANPDKRPFVLTRASYLGGQRYAATWTGDNQANWDHLAWSIPMILNLGLSGQPFSGPDIGGFEGREQDGEMYARWMGIGALFPFARGHSTKGSPDKEPWAFGEATERTCRMALQRRYRLMPYLYTLFHEAAESGMPVMRPLFFADPADARLRGVEDAFLLGADLLVRANVSPPTSERRLSKPEPGSSQSEAGPSKSEPRPTGSGNAGNSANRFLTGAALSTGIWRRVTLIGEDEHRDANLPTLYIRGGSIIPLGRIVESTAQESLDPLTLVVCLDKNGEARGRLYEDAGDGFGYRKGEYLLTEYAAKREGAKVVVRVASSRGEMKRPERESRVEVVTENGVWRGSGRESTGITAKAE